MPTRTSTHDNPTAPTGSPKKRPGLSMQIYSAMLGDAPAIDRSAPLHRPRLKMRVKVEARLEHASASPFHRTTFREHIERCAAYAARAIDDARERLAASRPKPVSTLGDPTGHDSLKSIVLIGPAARAVKAEMISAASRVHALADSSTDPRSDIRADIRADARAA